MILDTIIVAGVVLFAGYVETKGKYYTIDNHATFRKILDEGLYHFTSLENCNKIIESGYVKASSITTSYNTSKKSFFFAGIPSFEDFIINCTSFSLQSKATAIKIKPTYEQLASFKSRKFNDNAIVYDGNCTVDDKNVSIAYIVADFDDNKRIHYREVDKEIYDTYQPSIEFQKFLEESRKHSFLYLLKALKIDAIRTYERVSEALNQQLHRLHLIKDNTYANKPLKKAFNFREGIKNDIEYSLAKLKNIGFQKNKMVTENLTTEGQKNL